MLPFLDKVCSGAGRLAYKWRNNLLRCSLMCSRTSAQAFIFCLAFLTEMLSIRKRDLNLLICSPFFKAARNCFLVFLKATWNVNIMFTTISTKFIRITSQGINICVAFIRILLWHYISCAWLKSRNKNQVQRLNEKTYDTTIFLHHKFLDDTLNSRRNWANFFRENIF